MTFKVKHKLEACDCTLTVLNFSGVPGFEGEEEVSLGGR